MRALADQAVEDPRIRAADRWKTLRKFAPALIEALAFKAARSDDPVLAAINLLRDLNRSDRRELPADAPLPFRKDWRRLVMEDGRPNRRLYETAVLATLRDKLRSGDVWVERSSGYRRFDSYLLPETEVPAAAAALGLPDTVDEWLATRGQNGEGSRDLLAGRDQRRHRRLGAELREDYPRLTPAMAEAAPVYARAHPGEGGRRRRHGGRSREAGRASSAAGDGAPLSDRREPVARPRRTGTRARVRGDAREPPRARAETDWELLKVVIDQDRVLVTGNAIEFRGRCRQIELHPGMVLLLPRAASKSVTCSRRRTAS